MLKYYDVECGDCNSVFEALVKNGDIPSCKGCGSENVKRVYSTFNFKLKYNNKTDMVGGADNNYETSQYYRKVNEARARGENVKPPGD